MVYRQRVFIERGVAGMSEIDACVAKIAEFAANAAREDIEMHSYFVDGDVWSSPIERGFFLAFMVFVHNEYGQRQYYLKSDDQGVLESEEFGFHIRPQYKVNSWRVDYAIRLNGPSGMTPILIVECDGHHFHERTKEQAASDRNRDRELQKLGYAVFRFTGSEIWRDPMRCAATAAEFLWNWTPAK